MRLLACFDAAHATNDVERETGLSLEDTDVVVTCLRAVAHGVEKYAGQDGNGRYDGLALRDVRHGGRAALLR